MKTHFDTQERNEISRRIKQCEEHKRDPLSDLEKAISSSQTLGKKFRESNAKGSGFSSSSAENYARALREQALCEEVLRQLDKDLKIEGAA